MKAVIYARYSSDSGKNPSKVSSASVRSMPNETASTFSAAISTERCPPEPQTDQNFKI